MVLLRNSLHGRIFAALALVALLSIAGLGLVAYFTQRSALERQFRAELTTAADFKKNEIEAWFAERQSDVEFLAENLLNRQHLAALRDPTTTPDERTAVTTLLTGMLAGMQQLRTDYTRLLIASPDGTILISPTTDLVGKQMLNRTALQATLAHDGVYVQDIRFNESTGTYEMCFGHLLRSPVPSGDAPIIGVLFIVVDMEKSIYPMLTHWHMGKTGAVVLSRTEPTGTRLLNQVRYSAVPPLAQLLPFADPLRANSAQLAAQGEEGEQLTVDHLNATVITIYRHLPELRWGLVFKMDVSEIYAPLHQLVIKVSLIAVIVLVVVTLLALWIARSLTQPLQHLVVATRAVAQGNLAVSVDMQRNDEMGELAVAFREMVTSLHRHQYQLKAANQIARGILSSRPRDEVLQEIVHAAQRLTNAANVALYIKDEDGGTMIASPLGCELWLPANAPLPASEQSPPDPAFQTRDPFSFSCTCGSVCRQLPLSSLTALPSDTIQISVQGREQPVGLWLIQPSTVHPFTETDYSTFATLATHVAVTLENAHLLENWKRWHGELEVQVAARTHELAQANARLHELDEMKSEFIYTVSHELRNPISNLKLQLELLRNNVASPRRDRYIAAIGKQVDLMALLVKDMLDLIQLDKMVDQLELTPLDLCQLIESVVARHHAQLADPRVRLIWTVAEPSLMVKGERLQLERAFDHLVRNAVNFTPVGEITISAQRIDGTICVEIKDTGIGIADEDLPHIFQRFYRGGNVSQSTIPGSGLGLSLVQEVARLHHGQLAVESQLNQGTRLRFCLPYYQPVGLPVKVYH